MFFEDWKRVDIRVYPRMTCSMKLPINMQEYLRLEDPVEVGGVH